MKHEDHEDEPGYPSDWDGCTVQQLEKLAEHGSYGQRLIARRHLIELAKQLNSDHIRATLKRMGPG